MEVEEKQIGIIGTGRRRAVTEMGIQIQNQRPPDSPTAKVVNSDGHVVDGRQGATVVGIGVVTAPAKHPGHSISQGRIYGVEKCPKNREPHIDTAQEPFAPG